MTDHHIVEGNEINGYCDVCGMGGNLTTISCSNGKRLIRETKRKLKACMKRLR